MAKYKKLDESVVDRFVEKLFIAIGRGLSPFFMANISAKDPVLGKKIKQLKRDRKEVDHYIKKTMKKNKLTRKEKRALDAGQWPF